jgi:hypothetical protein
MRYDIDTMLPEGAFQPAGRKMSLHGGGKGGGGQVQQAAAQDWANTQQGWERSTAANRPTIETPWGKQTWERAPGTDDWTQKIELSPGQQESLDAQQRIGLGRSQAAETLLGQATEAFQKPMDWEGMGQVKGLADVGYNPEGARNRAEQALFQRQVNLLEPGLTRSEDARRARMAAMGIPLEGGSQAFERAQQGMDASRQKAYSDAALSAIAGGGSEATRELGMATGAAGFENQLRQQKIAEEMQRRGMSLNELNALLTGQQVQMPGGMQQGPSSTAGQMGGSNFAGAAANDAQLSGGSDWGTLLGTGAKIGSMFAMSDRRLKRNIKPLGGGWYSFDYVWGGPRQIGVMAQEVMLTNPAAVHVHPSGYLMVDYGSL